MTTTTTKSPYLRSREDFEWKRKVARYKHATWAPGCKPGGFALHLKPAGKQPAEKQPA